MAELLNEADIDFMYDSINEIKTLRERLVSTMFTTEIIDDITGEVIGRETDEREVPAVITELVSTVSGDDRQMISGIIIEEGDVKIDIQIEHIEDIAEDITKIKHDGKEYEVLASGKKGIGRRNRVEFIGRLIA